MFLSTRIWTYDPGEPGLYVTATLCHYIITSERFVKRWIHLFWSIITSLKRLVQSHSSNNNWKSRIKPNGSNCDSETSRYVKVVTLTIICPPLCRRFFHKGCVVVFFSVTAVKSLTYNVTLQIKITDLSVGSGNEVNSRFLAGWPAFEKPANFGGKATLA